LGRAALVDQIPADPRTAVEDRMVARVFTPVAAGYWRGPTAFQAWALTLGLGAAVLFTIGSGVAFSWWNRWFFDALEQKDSTKVGWSVLALLCIAVIATSAEVALVLTREASQVWWRRWLSALLMDHWMDRQRFFHLNSTDDEESSVPEYRIADDIRWATEPIMDFYIGLLGATVSIGSFVGILWVVGGSITLGSGDYAFTVPGYMAVAGVIHASVLMALMFLSGRQMPARMAARNDAEAHFRLSLMRVRENADSVAATHGESGERAILSRALDQLVNRWMWIVRKDGQLTWILRGNGVILPMIPLLLATPKYLSGDLSLGAVMQLVSAYLPFQTAIAWAVDNFRALSNWHASARRVAGLIQSMRDLDVDLDDPTKSAIKLTESADGRVHVKGLTITNREGDVVISNVDLVVEPGEKIMLTGDSGTGKSALGRTIAGLWPWGTGSVQLPKDTHLSFVPSRAYLPLGSLRDAIRYPLERLDADDATIADLLARCGIGHLMPRLDDLERWDQMLSNGERQRLAIARLLLQRPTLVILDDALGAFADDGQAEIMELLRASLRDTTLISVAQHGGLERFHDRTLTLVKAAGGARFKE